MPPRERRYSTVLGFFSSGWSTGPKDHDAATVAAHQHAANQPTPPPPSPRPGGKSGGLSDALHDAGNAAYKWGQGAAWANVPATGFLVTSGNAIQGLDWMATGFGELALAAGPAAWAIVLGVGTLEILNALVKGTVSQARDLIIALQLISATSGVPIARAAEQRAALAVAIGATDAEDVLRRIAAYQATLGPGEIAQQQRYQGSGNPLMADPLASFGIVATGPQTGLARAKPRQADEVLLRIAQDVIARRRAGDPRAEEEAARLGQFLGGSERLERLVASVEGAEVRRGRPLTQLRQVDPDAKVFVPSREQIDDEQLFAESLNRLSLAWLRLQVDVGLGVMPAMTALFGDGTAGLRGLTSVLGWLAPQTSRAHHALDAPEWVAFAELPYGLGPFSHLTDQFRGTLLKLLFASEGLIHPPHDFAGLVARTRVALPTVDASVQTREVALPRLAYETSVSASMMWGTATAPAAGTLGVLASWVWTSESQETATRLLGWAAHSPSAAVAISASFNLPPVVQAAYDVLQQLIGAAGLVPVTLGLSGGGKIEVPAQRIVVVRPGGVSQPVTLPATPIVVVTPNPQTGAIPTPAPNVITIVGPNIQEPGQPAPAAPAVTPGTAFLPVDDPIPAPAPAPGGGGATPAPAPGGGVPAPIPVPAPDVPPAGQRDLVWDRVVSVIEQQLGQLISWFNAAVGFISAVLSGRLTASPAATGVNLGGFSIDRVLPGNGGVFVVAVPGGMWRVLRPLTDGEIAAGQATVTRDDLNRIAIDKSLGLNIGVAPVTAWQDESGAIKVSASAPSYVWIDAALAGNGGGTGSGGGTDVPPLPRTHPVPGVVFVASGVGTILADIVRPAGIEDAQIRAMRCWTRAGPAGPTPVVYDGEVAWAAAPGSLSSPGGRSIVYDNQGHRLDPQRVYFLGASLVYTDGVESEVHWTTFAYPVRAPGQVGIGLTQASARPRPVSGIQVRVSGRTAALEWVPPSTNVDGSAAQVNAYHFRYQAGEGWQDFAVSAMTPQVAPRATFENIPTGVDILFEIRAVNTAGESEPATANYQASYGPPSSPENLQWSIAAGVIHLSWQPPATPGNLTTYVVRDALGPSVAPAVHRIGLTTAYDLPATIGQHYIGVSAENADGESAQVQAIVVVEPPRNVGDQPSGNRVSIISNATGEFTDWDTVTLRWKAPEINTFWTWRVYRFDPVTVDWTIAVGNVHYGRDINDSSTTPLGRGGVGRAGGGWVQYSLLDKSPRKPGETLFYYVVGSNSPFGSSWDETYISDVNTPPTRGSTPGNPTQLARGGIVMRPLTAIVGEDGDEAIVPLSRLRRALRGRMPVTVTIGRISPEFTRRGEVERRLLAFGEAVGEYITERL